MTDTPTILLPKSNPAKPKKAPSRGSDFRAVSAAVRAELGDVLDPQFIGAAALLHGRPFPTVRERLPKGVAMGTPMLCHANSRRVALRDPRYRYAEGVAQPLPLLIDQRLSHAWLVDEEDAVVDRTWVAGGDYHGVIVPTSTLRAVAAFARAKRRSLGLVTDRDGRMLLQEMGLTLEQALAGL